MRDTSKLPIKTRVYKNIYFYDKISGKIIKKCELFLFLRERKYFLEHLKESHPRVFQVFKILD